MLEDTDLKCLCVFCGSSAGRPEYVQAAGQLGEALARRGISLVYGGGRVGMMGEVAKAILAAGGQVIGVIPQALVTMEVAFTGLTDLRVVGTMHERKALMAALADGFVALPGGLGTMEEFFEVLTWAQLALHHKPCGVLNVCHYYDAVMEFLDHAVRERFVSPLHRGIVLVADSADGLLEQFETYQPPQVSKAQWVLQMAGSQAPDPDR